MYRDTVLSPAGVGLKTHGDPAKTTKMRTRQSCWHIPILYPSTSEPSDYFYHQSFGSQGGEKGRGKNGILLKLGDACNDVSPIVRCHGVLHVSRASIQAEPHRLTDQCAVQTDSFPMPFSNSTSKERVRGSSTGGSSERKKNSKEISRSSRKRGNARLGAITFPMFCVRPLVLDTINQLILV